MSALPYDVVRPDPSGTIQSLASLGYTPEAALADLVDNCIAARATNVEVHCQWDGAEQSWVAVTDDGDGMDEAQLVRGMTIGGRGLDVRDSHDLGRFGMGLKTASFSQARQLVVASRSRPDGEWSVRTWDVDHVLDVGEWRLLRGCPDDAEGTLARLWTAGTATGTVVLWRRLSRLVAPDSQAGDDEAKRHFYTTVERIEQHLGMVFSRYLQRRRAGLRLRLNGNEVPAWDPFLKGHDFVEALPEERPLPGVRIQGFVLPHRSRMSDTDHAAAGGPRGWLDQQGFYVYRRDRLIVAGDWLKLGGFRKDEKHVLARIAVELPPDQDLAWSLDVKKSTAMPPPALSPHLKRVGKATRERAGAVIAHRGRVLRDRQTSSEDYAWRAISRHGRTLFQINRDHALLRHLTESFPGARSDLTAYLTMLEQSLPVGLIRATPDAETHEGDGADVPEDILALARKMLEVLLQRGVPVNVAVARVTGMPPLSDYPGLAAHLTESRPDGTEQE